MDRDAHLGRLAFTGESQCRDVALQNCFFVSDYDLKQQVNSGRTRAENLDILGNKEVRQARSKRGAGGNCPQNLV